MSYGVMRLPLLWSDWRFGVRVKNRGNGRDVDFCFGPLVVQVWWRRWEPR